MLFQVGSSPCLRYKKNIANVLEIPQSFDRKKQMFFSKTNFKERGKMITRQKRKGKGNSFE